MSMSLTSTLLTPKRKALRWSQHAARRNAKLSSPIAAGMGVGQVRSQKALATAKHDVGAVIRPMTMATTSVICISSLINGSTQPSVKFACAATVIATVAAELALRNTASAVMDPQSPMPQIDNSDSGGSTTTTTSSSSSSPSTLTQSSGELAASILSHPLAPRAAAAAAVGAAVISAVLPPEDLPVVSSLCLLLYVGVIVTQQQQQQQVGSLAQEAVATALQEKQELQLQLQRQTDQVQNMRSKMQQMEKNATMKVQQLERELKQSRKEHRKLDTVKAQLKQEQADKQELAMKLLLLESQLQSTQLAAEQAVAKATAAAAALQSSQSQGSSSSQPASSAAIALDQQQEQQQPTAGEAGSSVRAARRVVAFVGGNKMKKSDRKLLPPDVDEIRFFGSPQDTGTGDLKRLEAALKAGSIDEVYMLTRWNGHTTTQMVSRLCRDRGIPYHLLDAGGKARRKGEWAEATSGSDTEAEFESS